MIILKVKIILVVTSGVVMRMGHMGSLWNTVNVLYGDVGGGYMLC